MRAIVILLLIAARLTGQNVEFASGGITSPDTRIRFHFSQTSRGEFYKVDFDGKPLVKSSQFFLLLTDSFPPVWKIGKITYSNARDSFALLTGKTSFVLADYHQAIIPLIGDDGSRMAIVVRVYNDAVAFHYEIQKLRSDTSYDLKAEYTEFRLAGDPEVLTLFRPGFTTSHEGFYSRLPLSKVKEDTLMDMPTLFSFPDGRYLAITEARLRNYAGMYLVKSDYVLQGALSPLPGRSKSFVRARLPAVTPWRVLMIADRPGALIESNVLACLNDPPANADWSWLKPGKTTFHWWNGDVLPDTTFPPGINFEFNKYYIDFCARNQIEYHTVIGYGGTAWYQNDGDSYAPGPHSDVTKPVASLDMQRVCDYAKSKGVGIRVWVHWKPLYQQLDKAFTQFEKWGISGMMVDFMDRDDQEMVNIQEEILQKAAAHHLHIQFHGAFKPTGLNRTYPNEFTREGTLNYENNKWGMAMSPDHDINMPFTRLLAGATDYHLGGFRAVPPKDFKIHYIRPLMIGTRCHMLAMYVVLESYLGMVCDYPQAYENQPGFSFIRDLPTTWDETKVPAAEVGKFVVIARRKGSEWFVGALNNSQARAITLPLNFLGEGNYEAEVLGDASDVTGKPDHLIRSARGVNKQGTLSLRMAAGGGSVIHFRAE